MKRVLKTTGWMGLALASPLFAIERPTPADVPKEKGKNIEAPAGVAEEVPPKAREKMAWLGVAGSPLSDTLSYHLGLEAGNGIALELVAPDSPAAQAGLRAHDVITKIGGTKVESMNDLRDALKGAKPGEVIEADIFAKGKAEKREITLGERPANLPVIPRPDAGRNRDGVGRLRINPERLPQGFLEGMGDQEREMIEKMFKGQLKELRKEFGGLGLDLDEMAPQGLGDGPNVRRLHFQLKDLMRGGDVRGKTSFMMRDENGISYRLSSEDDNKELEIKDRDGKLLFSGPYNTDVDKEAVPEDLRARIDELGLDGKNGNGFRIEINPGGR